MTEEQAEKIIKLLKNIDSNTSGTESNTGILSNGKSLDDLYKKLEDIKDSIDKSNENY